MMKLLLELDDGAMIVLKNSQNNEKKVVEQLEDMCDIQILFANRLMKQKLNAFCTLSEEELS